MMSETPRSGPETGSSTLGTADRPATSEPPDPATLASGVVVGVDDSASARSAVAWAAVAAERRGVGLHLVEVLPPVKGSSAEAEVPHGRARALLSRAQGIARGICPTLPVGMATLSGRVGPALVGYAAQARLLVVGSNGPGGPIPLSLGSILGELTSHASCPVVLVPAGTTHSPHADGPVLVAIDETPERHHALAFAAEVAHRRHVALVVLSPAGGSDHEGAEHELSTEETADLHARYPGLSLSSRTVHERPGDALLHADHDAQMLVVPRPRRGAGRAGARTGWTERFLPVLSPFPVAVVPPRGAPGRVALSRPGSPMTRP